MVDRKDVLDLWKWEREWRALSLNWNAAFVRAMQEAHPEVPYSGPKTVPPVLELPAPPPAQVERPFHPSVKITGRMPMTRRVLLALASDTGLTIDDIKGPRHLRDHVEARKIAFVLLMSAGMRSPTIGRLLGRDGSTVRGLARQARQKMQEQPEYAAQVRRIAEMAMVESPS